MTKKWLQTLLTKLCDQDSEFARYWLNLTVSHRHYVAFILVANYKLYSKPLNPGNLAGSIRNLPRKRLLKRLVGKIPPGFLNGIGKLKGVILTEQRYLDLWDLYHEEHARKVLQHLPSICVSQIDILVDLEPEYRRYSVVRKMIDREVLSTTQLAIQIVRSQRSDLTDYEISDSLGKSLNANGLITDGVTGSYAK